MKLEKKVDTIPISTKVTDEDLENAITIDGAKYSRDKKRLLKGDNISDFSILPGTEVICNSAFRGCYDLQQITIPNSVTHIGNYAFYECQNLQQITIPCGARAKFEKLLPSYHQLLKEMD